VRFGLRVVSTSGREIRLNGEPVKLRGFNRHDMYPNLGPSLPLSQYVADLTQLQLDLHANFIRGSHYPQDSRLLDLCDERGILVWDEALAWGNREPTLIDPAFLAAELGSVDAMVDGSINHPSVILWGFFNEGESDSQAASASYAAMAAAFRDRDRTRLVTWADNRMERSVAFEHADVISFNNYPGWYNGPAANVTRAWQGHAAWVAAQWPDKPFIISETGAGAVVGNHSDNRTEPARWSEEYQVLVDGLDVATAMGCANISGIALWQLMDIKVDESNSSLRRPGGINNKGVLDRWRRPKLAAAKVAQIYAST
jgi:beta-glucuronidase